MITPSFLHAFSACCPLLWYHHLVCNSHNISQNLFLLASMSLAKIIQFNVLPCLVPVVWVMMKKCNVHLLKNSLSNRFRVVACKK